MSIDAAFHVISIQKNTIMGVGPRLRQCMGEGRIKNTTSRIAQPSITRNKETLQNTIPVSTWTNNTFWLDYHKWHHQVKPIHLNGITHPTHATDMHMYWHGRHYILCRQVEYLILQRTDSVAEIFPHQLLPKKPWHDIAEGCSNCCKETDQGNPIPHTKESTCQHILCVHECTCMCDSNKKIII